MTSTTTLTDYEIIASQFDKDFYIKRTPEIVITKEDPIKHYLRIGWKEGRDPTPLFSTRYYLSVNYDVASANINPFVHFIAVGQEEGRLPMDPAEQDQMAALAKLEEDKRIIQENFDVSYYKRQLRENADRIADYLAHYLTEGWKENLDPAEWFSTQAYLEINRDVAVTETNPFVHYLVWGKEEGRTIAGSSWQGVETNEDFSTEPSEYPGCEASSHRPPSRELLASALCLELGAEEQESVLSRLRSAFDAQFYLKRSPDLVSYAGDIFEHFMLHGWREHRDPCPAFNTEYYLRTNPDVAAGGINPFSHYELYGKREGRKAQTYQQTLRNQPFSPHVTVIVPNYNHARFLRQRIDSILLQTYQNFDVILLDDCSSDNSLEIINEYVASNTSKVSAILNKENSGGVFAQWKKGMEAASGDLIWICESDDFCDLDFLERCIEPLRDPSVMISFGRVQFCDESGQMYEGLDDYRERVERGIWSQPFVRSAAQWFRGSFAIANVIPNVGGCIIRRQPIGEEIWREALTYKICGDWYLYCLLANGGRIAYCPDAIAYFRQHTRNTSVSGFLRPHYYKEHERIIIELRKRWGTPDDVAVQLYSNLFRHYTHVRAARSIGSLSQHFSNDLVLKSALSRKHILICFLGFHLGGGELFPIYLANALMGNGYTVSCLCLTNDNQNLLVRKMLDPRVAIYDAQEVKERGLNKFISEIGVDIINSHNVGVEFLFFQNPGFVCNIPYIVTLHGSYEVTDIPDDMMFRVLSGVSHWVYLTPKNLSHLAQLPIAKEYLSNIPNGLPLDDRAFELSREALGIGESDVVFMIASRAILEKGWEVAIHALELAQQSTPIKLHLILCGSGPEYERLAPLYENDSSIHLLGFQEKISGAYRISDVALLPSRFPGESYPLGLIQAMQTGRPIIATDIGEIPNMLNGDSVSAGLVIEFIEDDKKFVAAIAEAMCKMADPETRSRFAAGALKLGKQYDIDHVAKRYIALFEEVAAQQAKGHRQLNTSGGV